MMRNGCLILCQFQIPADVIFDYQRLVCFFCSILTFYIVFDRLKFSYTSFLITVTKIGLTREREFFY